MGQGTNTFILRVTGHADVTAAVPLNDDDATGKTDLVIVGGQDLPALGEHGTGDAVGRAALPKVPRLQRPHLYHGQLKSSAMTCDCGSASAAGWACCAARSPAAAASSPVYQVRSDLLMRSAWHGSWLAQITCPADQCLLLVGHAALPSLPCPGPSAAASSREHQLRSDLLMVLTSWSVSWKQHQCGTSQQQSA